MSATTEPTLDEIQAWMEAHPKVKQGFEMGRPYTMTPRRYIEWLLSERAQARNAELVEQAETLGAALEGLLLAVDELLPYVHKLGEQNAGHGLGRMAARAAKQVLADCAKGRAVLASSGSGGPGVHLTADRKLSNGETVADALEVIAACHGDYAGRAGCENCRERVALIAALLRPTGRGGGQEPGGS